VIEVDMAAGKGLIQVGPGPARQVGAHILTNIANNSNRTRKKHGNVYRSLPSQIHYNYSTENCQHQCPHASSLLSSFAYGTPVSLDKNKGYTNHTLTASM